VGLMGGGRMTPLGGATTVFLNDIDGTNKLEVRDADGFVVWSVDSKGNMSVKGRTQKVQPL